MSVKKSCILKYVKKKEKGQFVDFFLIWYLKLGKGMLKNKLIYKG